MGVLDEQPGQSTAHEGLPNVAAASRRVGSRPGSAWASQATPRSLWATVSPLNESSKLTIPQSSHFVFSGPDLTLS